MTALETLRDAPRRLQALVPSRPELRSIRSPRRRLGSIPFAVLVVTILVAGLVGLLWLNTTLQNRSFEVRAAQREATELGYRVSELESRVNASRSPAMLAGRATELGMVPNPNGVFIDLGSGRVVGAPKAATGAEVPSLRVSVPRTATDPAQIQKVVTSVAGWFDLDGVQAPLPPAPPAEAPASGTTGGTP